MDDITRAYYEGQFHVAFLTAKGDAFQTLFEKLMGKAYPADFIPCRPWGSVGDRKNDGYLRSERTLFQLYAPNEMRAADAIGKIDEDFNGALPYWKNYFDKWVFVHNAYNGLSPQIIDRLLELESQYAPLKLTHWSLEELRQRLQRIPLDGLQSLFGFAPTRHLAPSTLSFVRVRDARIYGTDTDPSAFSPSLREFEEQLVHRPVLAEQVETALFERRFACLLGKGASGKTTLALLLAFSKPFGPEQSYYFDLAEADDSPEAAEPYRVAMQAIASQHGRDALVIVDNIHLSEALAQRLHLAWREEGQPVRLLLQGRFTQQGADRRGRLSPLEDLKRTALVLEVTPNDLAGVLQRLARRADGNLPASSVPLAVLDQWLRVYGGELIAFSSAARRKLPQIVRGEYQLSEADAADFIRDEYLESQDPKHLISSAERENLLAIAACADWELSVPATGLPHPPGPTLSVSLRRGLVWQSTHGRYGQFVSYRLCHPGMGKLLWVAAKPNAERFDLACALAERNPSFGFMLASRLARVQGDQAVTKRAVTSAISRSDAFERLIEYGIIMLHGICLRLTHFGVLSPSELDERLVACGNLAQSAVTTPLADLAHFLVYAKTQLPKVWQVLAGALADEKNREALGQIALASPLGHLASFLEYAKTSMPKAWQAVADSLADEKNRATLSQIALASPLGDLANFLVYAKTSMPKAWQAVADLLADEKNRATLAQTALATPLTDLANFLVYAKTSMPKVWLTLADALLYEKNRQTLARTALTWPIADLANFLVYAKTSMPKVWQALTDTLGGEKNRQTLAQTALTTPLDQLRSFLEYAKTPLPKIWQALADTLADEKNRKTLSQTALASPLHMLTNLLVYAKTSMPEVWRALADTLADEKNRQTLSQTALASPLHILTNFLVYAKTSMLKVWRALTDTLADEKNRQTLSQTALASPLADLANFLAYAETSMPKVWQALADTLADEKNRQTLAHTALASPLADLANFLVYAKTSMPKVWQALADTLGEEKNRQTLAHTALITPLDQLRSFLEYAETPMPKIWQALADTLADEKNRQTLAQTALATPLDHLGGFLEYAKTPMPKVWEALAYTLADQKNHQTLAQAAMATEFTNLAGFMTYLRAALADVSEALNIEIAREFNASGIEHPRLQALLSNPRSLHGAERVLSGCGCQALAIALAGQLIQAADLSVWHLRGVSIKDVTTVLRLGNDSDEPTMHRFLGQVVTEKWLRTQYQMLPSQMLAVALQVLWAYTPRYVCDHFLAFFPTPRVEASLRFLHKAAVPVPAIPNLELLGASSLFNLDVCGTTRWWPPQVRLDELAHHFSVGLGEKRLSSHQILFLAGLREMVRHRPDPIRLVPEVGARVLTLLKATDSPLPNHQTLNAWLLEWLDRCSKHSWRLLKDSIPIPESVVTKFPVLPTPTDASADA